MNPTLHEADYIKAWAAFVVCATIGGFVAGFVAGVVLAIPLKASGMAQGVAQVWCSIAGFFAGLPVSYACFRFFVSRLLVERITRTVVPPLPNA